MYRFTAILIIEHDSSWQKNECAPINRSALVIIESYGCGGILVRYCDLYPHKLVISYSHSMVAGGLDVMS